MVRQQEPDMDAALTWWSELPAKWTPVGWKDSLFRFNVLFNGMVSCVPDLNPRTTAWAAQGLQVGVLPWPEPGFPGHVSSPQDNASVAQRWRECSAPVLISEWACDGIVFQEEIFTCAAGGAAVQRGDEPLYAWMRLSVADVLHGLPMPEVYYFNLNINAPYISVGAMSIRYNLAIDREASRYPRPLTAQPAVLRSAEHLRILEPDGKVRLAVVGAPAGTTASPGKPTEFDYLIAIPMPVRLGSSVDVLVPIVPVGRDDFDRELARGYDEALSAADRFWAQKPPTAARFETPEPLVNDTIRHSLRITPMLGERDPETGADWLLTGSWAYADQWATPAALQCALLLDTFGHFDEAEKYLRIYVEEQGSVRAKGEGFAPHPGSFGPPKRVAACDWTSDHGAILWAISRHALITGDKAFVACVTEAVVRGCEYVQFLRNQTGHGGIVGLMPPGVATDMPTQIQSVWADAFAYKGLSTAARMLRRVYHPRAAEFESEATGYRSTFVTALREASKRMPEWTDQQGRRRHLVPLAVHGEQDFEYRNAFYLDTGPLVLVWAGLLDADDEMMASTLEWFRNGPPRSQYRYDSDCWQVPSLHREMSSCEPVYSWNVFHSHQLGDRPRFLEGMYSLFAGMLSRQTFTNCETRGGVTGVLGSYLPAYLARLAVVDDIIVPDELHLMRLAPLAWLREGRECRFERMPTEFGPVDLRTGLSPDGERLQVTFEPSYHHRPKRVLLHVPPIEALQSVSLNGTDLDWDDWRAAPVEV